MYMRWNDKDVSSALLARAVWDAGARETVEACLATDRDAAAFMNREHDDGRGIFLLGGRIYRYRAPAYYGNPRHQFWVDVRRLDTPEKFIADLKSKGIGYVGIERAWFDPYEWFLDYPSAKTNILNVVASMKKIYDRNNIEIYQVP